MATSTPKFGSKRWNEKYKITPFKKGAKRAKKAGKKGGRKAKK